MDHLGVLQDVLSSKIKTTVFYLISGNMPVSPFHLSKSGNESTEPQEAVVQNGCECLPMPLSPPTSATLACISLEWLKPVIKDCPQINLP